MARLAVVVITSDHRDAGKTTLGTMLVRRLRAQGLRVAAVKHVHHGVDYRVKDTGRYREAGAETVYAIGPAETMIVLGRRLDLNTVLGILAGQGYDVVIVEGFKQLAEELHRLGACHVHVAGDGSVSVRSRRGEARAESLEEAAALLTGLLAENACSADRVEPVEQPCAPPG